MTRHLGDSRLNQAERSLQHRFRKSGTLTALLLFALVVGAALWMSSQPQIPMRPVREVAINFRAVSLPAASSSPLRLAEAWVMTSDDPRLQGLSGLAVDGAGFAAISDMGFVVRFAAPTAAASSPATFSDLRVGPGPFGRKVNRDAEAILRDPSANGWWIAYEQDHSVWRYDSDFSKADQTVWLNNLGWANNKGAEGLAMVGGQITAFAELTREMVKLRPPLTRIPIESDWDVSDAANAPDGSVWLLLRRDYGAVEAIAPLIMVQGKTRVGQPWPIPKGLFDNFEGMAIVARPGGWRFWLVTDDGHRLFARTLLVALDLDRAQENARR